MFLILSVFLLIVGSYFAYNRHKISEREAHLAIILCGLYIITFLFIPPFSEGISTSVYLGRGYGIFPILPLILILFPEFNSGLNENINQILGWLGFIVLASVILFFKYFIWRP
ncbi:hypothetical protein [Vibrio salinus]|uniref:hypothetical protein n=1 Tax=Vibrio salinus TaxID=2899784 RepID=UPI001E2E42AE|nr:hypothetical protein [Vibrio salinus]MCE0493871.1 hypothetical protein [Vibrio salinus]